MADLTDVSNALVALIAAALYPAGTGQPSAAGVPAIVYAGWPQASQLDADLAGIPAGTGRMHITVYPTKTEKNTTRYPQDLQLQSTTPATLTLTVSGQQITIGGSVSLPQNVALLIDAQAYTYAVQQGDTLDSIAAALAALVPSAAATGPVIAIASGQIIKAARAGGSGTEISEIRRQMRVFQISVWADTPDHRTAAARVIDPTLSALEFITLADGTGARIVYQSSCDDDMPQKANCYRRDMLYQVEYATTIEYGATEVVVEQQNIGLGVVASVEETFYQ